MYKIKTTLLPVRTGSKTLSLVLVYTTEAKD
jgi:hypothetical protein